MNRPPRRGFGVVQLVIVLAVILILIGLLLPAIQKAREAAARMASSNNIKQIALAVHNYHDVHGFFPAGVDGNRFSALAHLLPYLEQDALHRRIDFKQSIDVAANAASRATRIKVFENPRDEARPPDPRSGPTSYLLCAGSKASLAGNDGMFFADSRLRFADITDGTSNTMMAGETLRGDGNTAGPRDVRRQHVRLPAAELKGVNPDTGVKDFAAGRNIAADRGASWMDGRFLQSTFNAGRALNDPRPDVDCSGAGGLATLRADFPAVLIGMADGRALPVSASLPLATWTALATRAGGEVLAGF